MNTVSNTSVMNVASSASVQAESVNAVQPVNSAQPSDGVKAATAAELAAPKLQAVPSDLSAEKIQDAVDVINRAMLLEQRSLSFSVDEVSGRSIIKVVDQQSEQLIRQIPSEEVLRVAQDIKKLQDEMGQSLGLLIDRRV